MNTRLLEYFIAAAEEGNISRAAIRCYISQPALSQHIQRLEKELGVILFQRTFDGLTLTNCGKLYLNNARAILHMEQQTLENIRQIREQYETQLRLIASDDMHNLFLRHLLADLKKEFPGVSLSIVPSDQIPQMLVREEGDAGLFFAHQVSLKGLQDRPLNSCAQTLLHRLEAQIRQM